MRIRKILCQDSVVVKRNMYNFLKSFQAFEEALICISGGSALAVTFRFIFRAFGNLNSVSLRLT